MHGGNAFLQRARRVAIARAANDPVRATANPYDAYASVRGEAWPEVDKKPPWEKLAGDRVTSPEDLLRPHDEFWEKACEEQRKNCMTEYKPAKRKPGEPPPPPVPDDLKGIFEEKADARKKAEDRRCKAGVNVMAEGMRKSMKKRQAEEDAPAGPEIPFAKFSDVRAGRQVQVLRSIATVLGACRRAGIEPEHDPQRIAAAGKQARVLDTDSSDYTVLCRISGIGDVWFGYNALRPIEKVPFQPTTSSSVPAGSSSEAGRKAQPEAAPSVAEMAGPAQPSPLGNESDASVAAVTSAGSESPSATGAAQVSQLGDGPLQPIQEAPAADEAAVVPAVSSGNDTPPNDSQVELQAGAQQREQLSSRPDVAPPPVPAASQPDRDGPRPAAESLHSLLWSHSPYSCAVCKSMTKLMLCGSCKSVRFCGREHQRKFWPKHKSVCKFVSACQGGLFAQVSGKSWHKEAIPKIIEVWVRDLNRDPDASEIEQLRQMPRCRLCRKVPATLVCEGCKYIGYCSEACRDGDVEHRKSWQCRQVALTAEAIHSMSLNGGPCPFEVQHPDTLLSEEVYQSGWLEYINVVGLVGLYRGKEIPFLDMESIAQQGIIDSLSYPLSVMEALHEAGCGIHQICANKSHLEVHIFKPTGSVLTDLNKYEEWLHRAGPNVKTMDLWFVDPQAADKDCDMSTILCKRCRERGRNMRVHLRRFSILDWLGSTSRPSPDLRVAYEPNFFDRRPEMEAWQPILERLRELDDRRPFVITEATEEGIDQDYGIARDAELAVLLRPMSSHFVSPLAVYDTFDARADGKTGLLVWNLNVAVFSSAGCEEGLAYSEEESGSEGSGGDEEPSSEPLCIADAPANAIGDEVVQAAKRFLAAADTAEARWRRRTASFRGPWHFTGLSTSFEEVPYGEEANPAGAFSVQLSARCDGGSGYRSPLTSRHDKPASGFVFYVDPDDHWNFWVGDGSYWAGIRGPAAAPGVWTLLEGVVDPSASAIEFHVDGRLVERRENVGFAPNRARPLRLGAGRTERETPRFNFVGYVREVVINSLEPEEPRTEVVWVD